MRAFFECGWAAYALSFVAVLGLAVGLTGLGLAVFRVRLAPVIAGVGLMLALSAMGTGVLGTFLGERKVDRILAGPSIDPSAKAAIQAEGYAEARQCTELGLGLGAAPAVVGAAALLVALMRR
ncbi:MAG TPA: hypothetical protein VK524_00340 [Polyangiaceae bacterium]|nr:hypothetical protein [Polyangiaceae bacterium]